MSEGEGGKEREVPTHLIEVSKLQHVLLKPRVYKREYRTVHILTVHTVGKVT